MDKIENNAKNTSDIETRKADDVQSPSSLSDVSSINNSGESEENGALPDIYESIDVNLEDISATNEPNRSPSDNAAADTLNEGLHLKSVQALRGKYGAVFLPFIALALPFAAVAAATLLLLSPITSVVWQALSLSVYTPESSGGVKHGFKSFFAQLSDGLIVGASALYRLIILFTTLLFIIPSLFVRLNLGMFPYILKDKRLRGESAGVVEIFAESKELMKGNRLKYLSLMLYLLPTALLTILTLGLISVWSIPYMAEMKANFYAEITGAR